MTLKEQILQRMSERKIKVFRLSEMLGIRDYTLKNFWYGQLSVSLDTVEKLLKILGLKLVAEDAIIVYPKKESSKHEQG